MYYIRYINKYIYMYILYKIYKYIYIYIYIYCVRSVGIILVPLNLRAYRDRCVF